jgi:hypothetical protein
MAELADKSQVVSGIFHIIKTTFDDKIDNSMREQIKGANRQGLNVILETMRNLVDKVPRIQPLLDVINEEVAEKIADGFAAVMPMDPNELALGPNEFNILADPSAFLLNAQVFTVKNSLYLAAMAVASVAARNAYSATTNWLFSEQVEQLSIDATVPKLPWVTIPITPMSAAAEIISGNINYCISHQIWVDVTNKHMCYYMTIPKDCRDIPRADNTLFWLDITEAGAVLNVCLAPRQAVLPGVTGPAAQPAIAPALPGDETPAASGDSSTIKPTDSIKSRKEQAKPCIPAWNSAAWLMALIPIGASLLAIFSKGASYSIRSLKEKEKEKK